MYKPVIASTLIAVLALTPVLAVAAPTPEQHGNLVGTTRYPPSPHHSDLGPQPLNSLPRGAATHAQPNRGAIVTKVPAAPTTSAPNTAATTH